MSLVSGLKKFSRFFASKILDLDDTSVPVEQFKIISDLFSRNHFSFSSKNFKEIMQVLKKKHVVDSIIVAKKDGNIVASSENNGFHDAIMGTALFNYVCSELPKSKSVFVKQDDSWFMVFPFDEKIFMIKASASLSTIELKAIAKELDFLMKNSQSYFVDQYFESNFAEEKAF